MKILFSPSESKNNTCKEKPIDKSSFIFENLFDFRMCRRKNKISIWKNKTSIKVEILFFYKP
ncbi:hypothetical protein GL539_03300 [Campylobacter coli]|nr:hypothetical protein [Campylobacter coli]EDO8889152.1 hypothetical protein [Campylobacter coli]